MENKKENTENNQTQEEKPENLMQEESEAIEAEKNSDFKAKYDEVNDKYLRLYSDFDNFRKRTAKEKIEWFKSAGEDIFKNLLPVLDDFERAMKASEKGGEQFPEGIKLIYNKLKNTLTQKGLEEMKTIGEEFNTDLHEAITNIPAPSEDMKGKVVDEAEKGYLLNGKVLRFAKVIVGN